MEGSLLLFSRDGDPRLRSCSFTGKTVWGWQPASQSVEPTLACRSCPCTISEGVLAAVVVAACCRGLAATVCPGGGAGAGGNGANSCGLATSFVRSFSLGFPREVKEPASLPVFWSSFGDRHSFEDGLLVFGSKKVRTPWRRIADCADVDAIQFLLKRIRAVKCDDALEGSRVSLVEDSGFLKDTFENNHFQRT